MVLKRIGEAVGEVTAGFVFIHHQVGDVIAYSLERLTIILVRCE